MDDEKTVWVPTNYGTESGIRIGPFSGSAIYIEAAALFGGFLVFYTLMKGFGWPLLSSFLVGLILPLIVGLFLVKLVVGRPQAYWSDSFEYWVLRLMRRPLIVLEERKGNSNED